MSQEQRLVGKDLIVEFIVNGGGTYTISGDQTDLSVTFDSDEADLTAGADTYRFMKPTVKRNSATLTVFSKGEDDSSSWGNLPVPVAGQLLFYPKGKTSGYPKGGFPCYLKTKTFPHPFAGGLTRQAMFSPQGGTYGTDVFDPDVHTYSV